MGKYAKAIVAICGAVLTTVLAQFPDNSVVQQWGPVAAAFLTAVSVYLVPNTEAPAPKNEAGVTVVEVCALIVAFAAVVWLALLFLR